MGGLSNIDLILYAPKKAGPVAREKRSHEEKEKRDDLRHGPFMMVTMDVSVRAGAGSTVRFPAVASGDSSLPSN